MKKTPKVNVDILVISGKRILLGLLTDKWRYKGKNAWGVPGRDIRFKEKIGDTIKRNIQEEFGCNVAQYKIISVNANYALGNHYIGIGVIAKINGSPKLLIPDDWKEWNFFSKNNLPKNIFPPAKNLVECYLKNKFIVSE